MPASLFHTSTHLKDARLRRSLAVVFIILKTTSPPSPPSLPAPPSLTHASPEQSHQSISRSFYLGSVPGCGIRILLASPRLATQRTTGPAVSRQTSSTDPRIFQKLAHRHTNANVKAIGFPYFLLGVESRSTSCLTIQRLHRTALISERSLRSLVASPTPFSLPALVGTRKTPAFAEA